MSGAVSTRPSAAPATSIARFAIRTLRNTSARVCTRRTRRPRHGLRARRMRRPRTHAVARRVVCSRGRWPPRSGSPCPARCATATSRCASSPRPRGWSRAPRSAIRTIRSTTTCAIRSTRRSCRRSWRSSTTSRSTRTSARAAGSIEIAITPTERELVIEIEDHGQPFDIDEVAPLPTELDEDIAARGRHGHPHREDDARRDDLRTRTAESVAAVQATCRRSQSPARGGADVPRRSKSNSDRPRPS